MKLEDITDHNSDEAFFLLAEYTIVPRAMAYSLACIENLTREPDEPNAAWTDMLVADPQGCVRRAVEIVEEGREYMHRRIAAVLRARRPA